MSQRLYRVEEKVDVFHDYVAITEHIERWTGDRELADRTVDAIRDFLKSFSEFPNRGTCRDDLRLGLRIVPYKKESVPLQAEG